LKKVKRTRTGKVRGNAKKRIIATGPYLEKQINRLKVKHQQKRQREGYQAFCQKQDRKQQNQEIHAI